jgi:hypothetical protein
MAASQVTVQSPGGTCWTAWQVDRFSLEQNANAIDFVTWDGTDFKSVLWDRLSFLLSGSDWIADGDLPIYVYSAILFAWSRSGPSCLRHRMTQDYPLVCKLISMDSKRK